MRQQERVLRLLALGWSWKEIGAELGIRPRTVESHAYAGRHRLGLRTRRELVAYAIRAGWMTEQPEALP